MNARPLRACLPALLAALAIAGALGAAPAQASGITTPEILTKTIAAYPSCIKYQVKGVCFFLKCKITGCKIRTSIRVEHYVPDAIVSTYNEGALHPWIEVGKPIAAVSQALGSAMSGSLLDASANNAREDTEMLTFKSADAIGNPAAKIVDVIQSGQLPDLPDHFTFPTPNEALKFRQQELPRILQAWRSVPASVGNNLLEGARALAQLPTDILNFIAGLPARLSRLQSAVGNVGQILNGGMGAGQLGVQAANLAGIDLGPLRSVVEMASIVGDAPLRRLFCPGASTPFGLNYLSDVDTYFWRGIVPVESLYPQSWVPGMDEVSQNALIATWGGRHPRTGEVVQSHGVKASAVIAERVGSIIKQEAQPHIYAPLKAGGGFKYFGKLKDTRWQMLYPASTGCITFGENDSLGLASWGDFKTSEEEGYVWNMWNKYDCCEKRGSYLFSVP